MNNKVLQACIAMIQSGDTDLIQMAVSRLQSHAQPLANGEQKQKRSRGRWRHGYLKRAQDMKAEGLTYLEIGQKLGVSRSCIQDHLGPGNGNH